MHDEAAAAGDRLAALVGDGGADRVGRRDRRLVLLLLLVLGLVCPRGLARIGLDGEQLLVDREASPGVELRRAGVEAHLSVAGAAPVAPAPVAGLAEGEVAVGVARRGEASIGAGQRPHDITTHEWSAVKILALDECVQRVAVHEWSGVVALDRDLELRRPIRLDGDRVIEVPIGREQRRHLHGKRVVARSAVGVGLDVDVEGPELADLEVALGDLDPTGVVDGVARRHVAGPHGHAARRPADLLAQDASEVNRVAGLVGRAVGVDERPGLVGVARRAVVPAASQVTLVQAQECRVVGGLGDDHRAGRPSSERGVGESIGVGRTTPQGGRARARRQHLQLRPGDRLTVGEPRDEDQSRGGVEAAAMPRSVTSNML